MPQKVQTFSPFPKVVTPQRRDDVRWYHRSQWHSLRNWKLRINPVCERCQTAVDLHVHHIKARKQHPELALTLGNLMTLCRRCHSLEEHETKPDHYEHGH